MAEQIIITQGDYGIEISPTFVDKKKKSVDLTNCSVEISFVYPSKSVRSKTGQILDTTKGLASTILDEKDTAEAGLVTTFWKVVNESSEVTAQEEIYYFVREYLGGNA